MHDLLSFTSKPRLKHTPTDGMRQLVGALVDDIQIIAAHDREVVLEILARFAHEQRVRILEEDRKHGRL